MSASTCRGCGQPLQAALNFCTNCGVRSVSESAPPIAGGAVATPVAPTVPIQSFAAPTVATAPVEAKKAPDGAKVFIAILLALVSIAAPAGAFFLTRPEPQGDIVAEGPMGPGGGELAFGNGGKVTVPQGALQTRRTINVRRTFVRERVTIPVADGTPLVFAPGTFPIYVFGPVNLVFLQPITIVLPLPANAVAGRIFALVNGRLVFLAQRPNQGGFVSLTVSSFRAGQIIAAVAR